MTCSISSDGGSLDFNTNLFSDTRNQVLSRLRRSSLVDDGTMTVGPITFDDAPPKKHFFAVLVFIVSIIRQVFKMTLGTILISRYQKPKHIFKPCISLVIIGSLNIYIYANQYRSTL